MNVLSGPKPFVPIETVSVGIQIYRRCLKVSPEEILYIDAVSGKTTTYRNFLSRCCYLAEAMKNCGYKLDDVVVVSGENSSLFCVPIVASMFLGVIAAALNHTYTQDELSHLIPIFRPKIIFCSRKVLDVYIKQKKRWDFIERIVVLEEEDGEGFETIGQFTKKHCRHDFNFKNFVPVELDPLNQIAVILCSSGTSGMPKGVMITHDNISTRINQLYDPKLNLMIREVICAVVPFFHACGLMMNLGGIAKGSTIVFLRRFEDELFLKTIEKYKINNTTIVPTIGCILVKGDLLKKHDLSSVLEIFCGGASLSPEVERKIVESFQNLETLRQGYGLTETTFTILSTPTGKRKLGSVGKVVAETKIFIRDLETGKALEANKRGEICVKSRLLSKGYYNNPNITETSFKNGWFFTGDVGYYDEEGYFFIVDRIKEIIKYKGFQVSPAEVEGILLSHPDVKEACVVGKPDELAGELPTAFVVKKALNNVSEEEIIKFVAGKLSKPKQLHGGVYFIAYLPKTAIGKTSRKTLKDILMNHDNTQ